MDIYAKYSVGITFFPGEIFMISLIMKLVFLAIFLVSAIGKIISFDDTLIHMAGITKISLPVLYRFLWLIIILELIIPVLVLMNGAQSRIIFGAILFLLISFLIVNVLFSINGVENCGCFGTGIQSNPKSGILKTIILIVMLVFLQKTGREKNYGLS